MTDEQILQSITATAIKSRDDAEVEVKKARERRDMTGTAYWSAMRLSEQILLSYLHDVSGGKYGAPPKETS